MMLLLMEYPEFMDTVSIIHQMGGATIEDQTAVEYYSQFYADEGIEGVYFDFIADLVRYKQEINIIPKR